MPTAQHPQAKFDPIPPDFDLPALVERAPNFHWVSRISAAQIRNIGPQEFEKLVFLHVIHGGKPLVIEKWNDRLPKSLFSVEWLEATYNKKEERVRDLGGQTDMSMTLGHYLRSMQSLTNQWTPRNFRDERRQRLYMKDIDCPPEWQDYLQRIIPPNLYYMNGNVDERFGKARGDDRDMFQDGRSAAPAGDLMSSLPEDIRAQNLMCYVGHEGTYTPAHREMCASLGQNIMVDASGDENGEKPGSSLWFMTETKDREVVREYFLSMLGHDIEIEKHFAQVNAWKKATFPVYVVEQRVGDFILVPPLAPHQVWNRGTRTIKVAWNRTTVETLQLALHEALPKARLVCRDEQYKNKAIIFFTLEKYFKEMVAMEKTADIGLLGFGQDLIENSTRMKQMAADFKALFRLFTEIMVDEMFATREKEIDYIAFDSNITCSYCRSNIFNRFLTCKNCVRQLVNGDEDTYDICMECYNMGRSCFCVSNLTWCEQWHWSDLVDRYESWRALIIKNDGYVSFDSSPLPLELARKMTRKKSVAQICQEQLQMRPWNDITKVKARSEPEESEIEVDDNGRPVKKKRKKKRTKEGAVTRCHVCQRKDYNYKLAFCTNEGCDGAYCYGVLYRAFDLMPQDVMQNERWQCPKCLQMCSCGGCRRSGNGVPYVPKKTLLGHDTRQVADDRSVESLVDYRAHNLGWLKTLGDESRSLSSKRMQRLQQAAAAEKAKQAELTGQVPVLPDGALAESLEGAAMGQTATNGYPHENGVAGAEAAPSSAYPAPDGAVDGPLQQNGHQPGPAQVADMSVTAPPQDQSSYPDPSALGRERMLGMGYYEQDDSPDKILFDPYQMPTAENMAAAVNDEPEMSEYLKKPLRIAKRRAQQEDDDDPDFRVSRSHHRKKPKINHEPPPDAQEVALSNMDPALFGGDETMTDAPVDEPAAPVGEAPATPTEAPAEAAQPAAEPTTRDGGANESQQQPRYSPNRPSLRHARPKISYVDDMNDEEEFNDIVIHRVQRPPEGITDFNPDNANKDPLGLASAAVVSMLATSATPAAQTPVTPAVPGRKRGRPRKSEVVETQSVAPKPPSAEPPREGRRRGRAPRARPLLDAEAHDGDDAPAIDLDAQIAQQLDGFDDDGEVISSEPAEPVGPRRRGRPPRNPQPAPPPKKAEVIVELPLMSMAERMRLKGKRFKIGQRSASGASKPATPAKLSAAMGSSPAQPEETSPTTQTLSQPRGRGRPRKETTQSLRKSATPAITSHPDMDKDYDPNAEEEEEIMNEVRSPSPRRVAAAFGLPRGFPRGFPAAALPTTERAAPPQFSPSPPAEPTPAPERAASPQPQPSPSPSPEPEPEAEAEPSPYAEPEPEVSPPPLTRVPAGPTIVRFMSSDDESEGDYTDSDGEEASESESVSG
ncbi:hypothetical protein C8A05DRAFT_38997, partial [Staphylotrichum tortipilum]